MRTDYKVVIATELDKVWCADVKMIKWCMNSISGVVKLSDGGFYCFEKPSITTRFCFGYGQNGLSTEEEFEDACAARAKASEKEYFIAANMQGFDELDRLFSGDEPLYMNVKYGVSGGKLRNVMVESATHYYKDIVGQLTDEDRMNLLNELEEQKKLFRKRLETYWKRFGNTKLKTWTYLVD